MAKFIINVGMQRSANFGGGEPLRLSEVTSKLSEIAGLELSQVKVEQSKSEQTVIAYFEYPLESATGAVIFYNAILKLSDELSQDCVAVFNADACTGRLVGRYDHLWGEFNMDYFLK